MSPTARATAAAAALCATAGLAGGWAGVRVGLLSQPRPPGLHALVHRELHLDPGQAGRMEALERADAGRRAALQGELDAADAALAHAIAGMGGEEFPHPLLGVGAQILAQLLIDAADGAPGIADEIRVMDVDRLAGGNPAGGNQAGGNNGGAGGSAAANPNAGGAQAGGHNWADDDVL